MTRTQRLGVLLGCALAVAVTVLAAAAVTPWSLVVLPVPLVLGAAAWHGVGPGTVWRVWLDAPGDGGGGPAGWLP